MSLFRRFSVSLFSILFLSLLVFSCGGGDSEDDSSIEDEFDIDLPIEEDEESSSSIDESSSSNVASSSSLTLTASTDISGHGDVNFKLPAQTNKFSVTVQSPNTRVRIDSVRNDRGSEWVSSLGNRISLAQDFAFFIKTVNVPSRDVDSPVLDYANYTVSATTEIPGSPITVTINSSYDLSLKTGSLPVNFYYVGSAAQRTGTKTAVNSAIVILKSLLAKEGLVNVKSQSLSIDGSEKLPNPASGDMFYLNAEMQSQDIAVNIFLGGDVDINTEIANNRDLLGIASDIPAPYFPSPRSAIAISLYTSAGPDGLFSTEEIRVLAETFAHNIGHQLGLFHPIEIQGLQVVAADPLTDTSQHQTLEECLSDDDLVSNIMFPFTVPLDNDPSITIPQKKLTLQQGAVLNRAIVVE